MNSNSKNKKERECDYLKALSLANGLQSLREGAHMSFLLQEKPGWKERLDRTQVPCKICFYVSKKLWGQIRGDEVSCSEHCGTVSSWPL